MTWNLNYPHALYPVCDGLLEIDLRSPLKCMLRKPDSAASGPPRAAIEIQPRQANASDAWTPLPCSDAYVRQSDLIVTYAQADPWSFGYQVDFRVHEALAEGVQGLELWLSIQTSLLESMPQLWIKPLDCGPDWTLGSVMLADHGKAAMVIHPLDQADCRTVAASRPEALGRLEVFGGFMEKGVIRRARLLIAWSDEKIEKAVWSQLFEEFADSPLPLTT
jgi:hypothetical protein